MPLEHEPKPSMREIVEAEIEQYAKQISRLPTGGHEIKTRVLLNWFNNFPCKLPDSSEVIRRRPMPTAIISGKSSEEFMRDCRTAVEESGVNKKALGQYINLINTSGISEGNDDAHRELLLPIFIKLREMGYTKTDLSR